MPKIIKTIRENRFSNSKKRFSKNMYDDFQFGNSLYSYSSDELCFTNFVKSKENELYKKLEQYILNTKAEDFNFLEDEFEPLDEVKYTEPAAKRLLEIINKGYKHNYKSNDLQYIFKIKNKEKSKFQFYLFIYKGILTVLLIDFFHLAIIGDLWVNGKPIRMKKEDIYKKEKDNKWNINNISI